MCADSSFDSSEKLDIAIRFGYSSSENFNKAVELAKKLSNYRCDGQKKSQEHSVSIQIGFKDNSTFGKVMRLMRLISNWKNKSIQISDITLRSYWEFENEYNAVKECFKQRDKSILGNLYCFGKDAPDSDITHFGCRLINAVLPTMQKHPYKKELNWYQFGELSDNFTSFIVDKDSIFEICKNKTQGSICTICPYFDWEKIKKGINELPDRIILGEDSMFEIKYAALNLSKPLGIKYKENYGRNYSTPLLRLGLGDNSGTVETIRNVPSVQYSDIAGQDNALTIIKSIIQKPLTNPDYFLEIGIEPHRGVIFYGPPGNGKTLIAKAVATESDAHLEIINGPEILSKWVGQSEENLRKIFLRSKKLEPSIILIDEIDSIAPNRNGSAHQHEISLISQLLVLLDGLETRGKTLVIGTTNRFDALNPALLRPGRFDYHVHIPMPDEEGRKRIMLTHLLKLKVDELIEVNEVCKNMVGFSGAEVAAVVREAGLVAIDRGIDSGISAKDLVICQNDLNQALQKIIERRKSNIV